MIARDWEYCKKLNSGQGESGSNTSYAVEVTSFALDSCFRLSFPNPSPMFPKHP